MGCCRTVVFVFSLAVLADVAWSVCRNDWMTYGDSCYAFVDEYVTWATANQICQALKSRLVEVDSHAENEFIASQMRARKFSSTWTGLQDFLREGTWVKSSDQEPVTYFNWKSGQPDNSNGHSEGGEDCVIVYNDGGWDDFWCDDTHHSAVVCEVLKEEELVG